MLGTTPFVCLSVRESLLGPPRTRHGLRSDPGTTGSPGHLVLVFQPLCPTRQASSLSPPRFMAPKCEEAASLRLSWGSGQCGGALGSRGPRVGVVLNGRGCCHGNGAGCGARIAPDKPGDGGQADKGQSPGDELIGKNW